MDNPRGPGRPKRGESAWRPHIADCLNVAMRILGREAEWRGYSMLQFSEQVGCDLRVLQRYFRSKKPQLYTITTITKALGYPPIVARALTGRVTDSECRQEWKLLGHELVKGSGWSIFGRNILNVSNEIAKFCRADLQLWGTFFVFSVTARHGLWRWWGKTDPALGPYFSAMDALLESGGCSLRPFIFDELVSVERKREAIQNLHKAFEALCISEYDRNVLWRILIPYSADAEAFREHLDTAHGIERLKTERAVRDAPMHERVRKIIEKSKGSTQPSKPS